MKRAVLHIVLLLFTLIAVAAHRVSPIPPSLGTWQLKSPMPEARSGATAVTLGDFIYVIGGKTASGTASNRVDRYNPSTDSWEDAEPLQNSRFNASSVVWNNTIVVTGGRGSDNQTLNSVEQFDPNTNTWTALGGLTAQREGHNNVRTWFGYGRS